MSTLGIDPGVARTGFGIVEENNKKLKLIDLGCITTSQKDSTAQRLKIISSEIRSLIKKYNPSDMAIEKIFFSSNSKTAIRVGEARGVILVTASQENLEVCEYSPLQVKQALTGYGKADKKQIEYMVKKLLSYDGVQLVDDAYDAAAIAICHINSRKLSAMR